MKRFGKVGLGGALIVLVVGLSIAGWTFPPIPVEEYKKWPNNWGKWGPNDEIGALNYITPQTIVDAAKLVKKGKVIPCSYEVEFFRYPIWGARAGLERLMNWS